MQTLRLLALFVVLHPVISLAQHRIGSVQGKDYVGQVATVCGKVAGVHQAMRSRGQPTFINLDAAYPNQIFTILIWGNDRPKFGNLEQEYADKQLCITGVISSYRGIPEIVTTSPGSIKLGQ
jgi:hypothetical protein